MKKLCLLVMFVGVCLSLSIGNLSFNKAGANDKCEVSFHFDGLQTIAFGDTNKVTDGILDAHHHTPKIQIKQIEKGKEKVIFVVEGKELYKKVLNVTVPNNLSKPTRYYSPDMSKDKEDFHWCLDMESDIFQKELYLKDNFLTKINFKVGTFYAENITEEKYQFATDSKIHSFNRQIGRPTLKVNLGQSDNLIISGLDKEVKLPYQVGVNYSVSIANLPPADMANIDHFTFYYDAVKTPVPRFMPMVAKKAAFWPKPIVCEAAIFGKSTIN